MAKYRTALAPSNQYSSRNGVTVDRFQVHHMAAGWAGGLATLTGSARTVSSTWAIGGGEIVMNVPLDKRPFVSASPAWDRRSESAEVANSRTGDASGWPVSAVDFDNLARVIADWSLRRGVPINDTTVLTHQELYKRYGASYPTACPGGLQARKAELLKLANKYRAAGARITSGASKPAASSPARKSWEATAFGIGTTASKSQWKTIQSWLKKLGRYDGPVDGVPGQNTWKGIQTTVKKYGYYDGRVDGVPGTNTAKGMQKYAANGGGYTGPIDGVLGPNSWAGFVKRLSS